MHYAAEMPSALIVAIGRNVRRFRLAANLSQQQLAEGASVHRNTIALLETFKLETMKLDNIERIASVLGVGVHDLMSDAEATASDPEVEQSWREFLSSPVAKDITEDEKKELRTEAHWPWGKPTPTAWFYALQALRSSKRKGE